MAYNQTGSTANTTSYSNGSGNTIYVRNKNPEQSAAAAGASGSVPVGAAVSVPSATLGYAIGSGARAIANAVGGGGTGSGDDINPNPGDNQIVNNLIDRYRGGSGGGSSGGGGGGSYSAPRLPTATDQSAYINAMYAANEQAARDNLRAEYENNLAQLDYQQGRLPGTYDSAVDQANAQAAINRANFNEQAAASGLNTGAGSQVRLSQNNALLGNVSAIRKAQADAQAELDFQRTQMEQQYQQAIREAVAQNDLQRAQALYQEARRVDESIVNTAINQANLDWSVWRSLYK